MTTAPARLSAGLYLVSTPLGAARDITLRALDILGSADVLAAEDTRTLRKLMEIHGIALAGRPLVACHDHSGGRELAGLVAAAREGKSVAYASEAGTPLVSDPGFALVRAMHEAGQPVTAAPGPTAAIAALTLSGLPADRFLFCGFPPSRQGERRRWLAEALAVPATAIFYESPRRIHEMFADLVQIGMGTRRAAVCRELTKRFEEVRRGTVDDLVAALAASEPRGEFVVLVGPGAAGQENVDVEAELQQALRTMSVKDAVQAVAAASGQPRREVYRIALRLSGGRE
jgi:16S rRNA (cytidine1402-2'-O)-methyltransferase